MGTYIIIFLINFKKKPKTRILNIQIAYTYLWIDCVAIISVVLFFKRKPSIYIYITL